MRSNRLGCLTGTGILAALVTVLVIAGYAYARGGLLFNPGPLNAQGDRSLGGVTSHSQIGRECKACHTAPWEPETMADRCIVCHTNIAGQMRDPETVHGALFQNDPALACRDCHREHRGTDAPLTVMKDVPFPHEVVGFSLSGHQLMAAGEPFACDDCHHSDITTFAPETCDTCHRQMDLGFMTAHGLSFGSACLDCHDGVDRFDENFNHSIFSFQLAGAHAGVACVQCHLNARGRVDFAATPQDCFSCHYNDEPHEGRFGLDCAACHTVDGWTPAEFDHNLAAFKLEGQHAQVACKSCHVNGQFRGTPMDCFSCHQQDDAHNGEFGTDCAACHNPSDWNDASFDHNLSDFPLTGAHTSVACESCHVGGQFQGLSTACVACHAEPAFHAGLFGTECAVCHNTTAWQPAEFNGPHTFPLNHGGGATCATCHPASFTVYTCYGCHEHNEAEIVERHLDKDIPNFQNCMECHATGEKD
jgi:hypothetical protein